MVEEQNKIKFFVVEDHTLTNRGIRELIGERSRFTCAGFAFSKTECLEKLNELAEEAELSPSTFTSKLLLQPVKKSRAVTSVKNTFF